MGARTQVAKWGSSPGLRLPKAVAREAQIGEADAVEVSVRSGAITSDRRRPAYSLDELLERITPRNRHKETSWRDPVGGEPW